MLSSEIEDHRKMMAMSGNLSEFQLTQLKKWPYVVVDEEFIDKIELSYDFHKLVEGGENNSETLGTVPHAGSVCYDFYFSKKPTYSKEELKNRIDALRKWTKMLFWEDTEVVFKKKGRKWNI